MKNILSLFVLLISSSIYLNGQEDSSVKVIEDVIIFNNESYKVRMTTKGKILEFLQDVDDSYASLNKVEKTYVEMDVAEVDNAIDLARYNGNTLNQKTVLASLESSESAKMKPKKMVETKQAESAQEEALQGATADSGVNPDEEMMSKGVEAEDDGDKPTSYDYEFAFDHREATLSTTSVNQITAIAEILKANENTEVNIHSYYSETVDISKMLSKNRAKGIQDMLISKGIDSSRIKIEESNNEDWANNRVKVSIH